MTFIYRESGKELKEEGWFFWGKRITDTENVNVYRKEVTLEEAEKYEMEQAMNSL